MRLRPVRRALRRLVRGTARRLPPRRGQAVVAGAQAVFTFLTGRPTRASRAMAASQAKKKARPAARKDPREREDPTGTGASPAAAAQAAEALAAEQAARAFREELGGGEKALAEGRHGDALRVAEHLGREQPRNLRILQLRAAALAGAGDAATHATALHRVHVHRDDPAVRREERIVASRLVETAPGWLPRLPGPADPVRSHGDDVVLYLAPESAPHRTTATTARLQVVLAGALTAGLRPEVVTALGFPRSAGVTEVARREVVDGIPHHRLDLGPHYALDGPVDARLRDMTWLAAAVARGVGPAVIHVIPGEDGLELALVGAALREHLGMPLIVDVAPRRDRPTGEDAARRQAAEARLLEAADHVIAADDATRDRLHGEGLDPGRVSVIEAGGASDLGTRLRGVYDRALGPVPARAEA